MVAGEPTAVTDAALRHVHDLPGSGREIKAVNENPGAGSGKSGLRVVLSLLVPRHSFPSEA